MVASVNPCGFLMLPAFGTYYLGANDPGFDTSPAILRAARALILGLTATAGFILLFGVIGLVLAWGGQGLIALFPWGGLLVGVALTFLGGWLLVTGNSVGILTASRVTARLGTGVHNIFLFGIAYGICSLSCTLPIFMVVVGTALLRGGLMNAVGQFVSYGLGMGMMLVAVTVSIALFRGALSGKIRSLLPYVHRAGGVFVLAAGLYIVYYWIVIGQLFA